MFDILFLFFSWLPAPLNIIAFGAICMVLVIALVKFIAAVIDMIPFL